MNIGQKIRKFRELRNLTQENMAENLQISQQAYSALEKEDNVPFNRLIQITQILNVPLEQIIGFDEKFLNINYGEKAINNIQTQYNFPEKLEKLYEDKIALLEQMLKMKDEQIEALKVSR